MTVVKAGHGVTALSALILSVLGVTSLAAEEPAVVASIAAAGDAELKGTLTAVGDRTTMLVAGRIDVSEVAPKPDMAVVARVDLSDQRMHVYVDGRLAHVWKVSTGRGSYRTPTGRWNAAWLSPRHRSRKYNNAPMPWSVFFHNGYAVHGTTDLKRLGRPASHGCVRLHPDNAKVFFNLVKNNGMDATLISIVR